jgi:hypothetical protein
LTHALLTAPHAMRILAISKLYDGDIRL